MAQRKSSMYTLLSFSSLPVVLRKETIIITRETRQASISGPKSTGKDIDVYLAPFPGPSQGTPNPSAEKTVTNPSCVHFFWI